MGERIGGKEDSDGCKGADAPTAGSTYQSWRMNPSCLKKRTERQTLPSRKSCVGTAETADRICNFNRHYAEYAGYFLSTSFLKKSINGQKETTYYDSRHWEAIVRGTESRTFEEFESESRAHGWPSFRDEEVVWDNARCKCPGGEARSTSGALVGHNLPDRKRKSILHKSVSVAAMPSK